MKQFDWRTFLIGLVFLSSTAFAMDTFYGDLGTEDLYFVNEVLIDGVELPEELDSSIGISSVEIEGTGTLNIGDSIKGPDRLNVSVFGGTTIDVERRWDDADTPTWFEGILPSPKIVLTPPSTDILYDDDARHSASFVKVLDAYGMGMGNESFSFSTPASFTFPAELPDGIKLWFAFKEDVTPAENKDNPTWRIAEGEYCVILNGLCILELAEFNEVALVEEYFYKCPRSSYSDTDVINGVIGSEPECLITCDRGYELDYGEMKCVSEEGTEYIPNKTRYAPATTKHSWMPAVPIDETEDLVANPGYYRYTGARENQLEKELEDAGIVGKGKYRVRRTNAADSIRSTKITEEKISRNNSDAGLMEYMMQVRNFFGAGSSANVVRSEEAEINSENGEGEMYSSAPLLPSTGPGLFLGLAALGLGCMVVGARGRRK